METDAVPTLADLKELERLHNRAVESLDGNVLIDDPNEPPTPVVDLMQYITRSAWCNRAYNPNDVPAILADCHESTLIEIRTGLTGLSRAERFHAGSWLRTIESRRMLPLISRARVLLDADPSS